MGDRDSVSTTPAHGIPRILQYIYWLMDRDRKSTALKSLQGKIWKTGFENGELKGTLFDDWFFGVSAISADGHESPVEFPAPAGSFFPPPSKP